MIVRELWVIESDKGGEMVPVVVCSSRDEAVRVALEGRVSASVSPVVNNAMAMAWTCNGERIIARLVPFRGYLDQSRPHE